jgi:acid stress-induced BolA-like protein IbaG/YrbA
MNKHIFAIRIALTEFVSERQTASAVEGIGLVLANDPPKPIVTPSGLTDDVHAIVYVPEFDNMTEGERQRMVWGYLKDNLDSNDFIHLSHLRTVSSDEWEQLPGMPLLDDLLATA